MSIQGVERELRAIYKDLRQGTPLEQKVAKNKIKAFDKAERELVIALLTPSDELLTFNRDKLAAFQKKLNDLKVAIPKRDTGLFKKIGRAFQNLGPNRTSSQKVIDAMKADAKIQKK